MVTVNFKAANASDGEIIGGFVRDYYELDGIPFNGEQVLPALLALLKDDALGRVWCIQAAGQDVGYMILTFGYDIEFGGRLATLTDLYLKPDFRGQGIGTMAFGFLEAFCREQRVNALELQVLPHNAAAQRLYGRLGFELLDRLPMHRRVLLG